MPYYSYCGFVIKSDFAFDNTIAELPGVQVPDFTLQVLYTSKPEIIPSSPIQRFQLENGTPWLSISLQAAFYLFHFPSIADFWIDGSGAHIRCYPNDNVPANTIEHLFLDQVMPRILSHAGHTLLHASGVMIGNQAVIFLGESGWGKSTLVASFLLSGYTLVADDSVLLSEAHSDIVGIGSYPGLRLWQDSAHTLETWDTTHQFVSHYSPKIRMSTIRFCDRPAPIKRVFVLSMPTSSTELTIEPIPPSARFMSLLEHSFRLDITDRERNAREFEILTQLAEKLPMYRLSYPRRYEMLPAVREAILAHVEDARSDE